MPFRRAIGVALVIGFFLTSCSDDGPETVPAPTSTRASTTTHLSSSHRDDLRALAGRFGHTATEAEIDAGFVMTVPGSAYDDLVAVRPNLGGVDAATANARRAGALTISVLRVSAGAFQAPRCPPSVNEDEGGCPTVRGDTVVEINFADGGQSRGVWTWAEAGAILEELRSTAAQG